MPATSFDKLKAKMDAWALKQSPRPGRVRVQKFCDPEGDRTVQSEAEATDINNIVARNGVPQPGVIQFGPEHTLDLTNIPDYREAIHATIRAEQLFNALPADLRAEFDNDWENAAAFVNDPENREEAIEMGLLPSPPAPEQQPAGLKEPKATETSPKEEKREETPASTS